LSKSQTAHPPLTFIPQRFNPVVRQLAEWLLPILLRFRTRPWLPAGISQIEVQNTERLVNLYHQFQLGKVRFLMAFRHPEVDDPLCMFHLLCRDVPRIARQHGVPLQLPIHSHFIYDRGMTIWAGSWLGWLFSRLGGTPVRRGRRLDWTGLKAARDLFANGHFPLSVAPEGATNGTSGRVSPLEPGVAQLGFWAVEELRKTNRPETVWIVPISIRYTYLDPPWDKLDQLLHQLEVDSGLAPLKLAASPTDPTLPDQIYVRLLRLSDHLLTEMEEFYRRFYHQPVANYGEPPNAAAETLITRLHRLLDMALQVSEQFFGLAHQGTVIDRCRHVEEAGWSYIYREDLRDRPAVSPFRQGLADWVAEEADLRMRHMRLVESFVAVTDDCIQKRPSADRMAELALLLFDVTARIKRQKLPHRPRLGWRRATITVGEPISVSDRYPDYQTSRQAARQAVQRLTQDLQQAMEQMIESQ